MKRNQRGSVVILLLIVLILGLGAFAIWRYVDSTNKQPVSQQTTQQIDSQNALKIQELGIKVTYPKNMGNLTYAIRVGETVDGKQMLIADLATKELEDVDQNCSAEWAPLGWLTRIDGQYPEDANVENSGGLLMKQFDTFHIDYAGPQATCTENSEVQELLSSVLQNLDKKSWIIEKL